MYHALVRNSRPLALQGGTSIAFGIIALFWPNLALVALGLFGTYALGSGAFSIGASEILTIVDPAGQLDMEWIVGHEGVVR